MTVLCAGPESNGVRLLSRIVATGAKVVRLSLPQGRLWWGWDADRRVYKYDHGGYFPCDRVVVILRDEYIAATSVNDHGYIPRGRIGGALWEQHEARWRISRFPDALVISYRDLIDRTEATLDRIGEHIGATVHLPESLVDGDVKYEGMV